MPHLKARIESFIECRQHKQPNEVLSFLGPSAKHHQWDALRFYPIILSLNWWLSLHWLLVIRCEAFQNDLTAFAKNYWRMKGVETWPCAAVEPYSSPRHGFNEERAPHSFLFYFILRMLFSCRNVQLPWLWPKHCTLLWPGCKRSRLMAASRGCCSVRLCQMFYCCPGESWLQKAELYHSCAQNIWEAQSGALPVHLSWGMSFSCT